MTGIERLRRYASDMRDSGWKSMHDDLSDIADLIECEQDKVAQVDWESVREVATDMAGRVFMSATIDGLLRDWSRKLTDAADGHDHAKDVSMSAYGLLPADYRDAIAWVRKNGGIGAVVTMVNTLGDTLKWIQERAGIGEDEVVDYDELLDALDRRLVPEDMEWPRFEDGEPLRVGDEFIDHQGNVRSVRALAGEA